MKGTYLARKRSGSIPPSSPPTVSRPLCTKPPCPPSTKVVHDLKKFNAASICRTRRVTHLRDLYGDATWTMGITEWKEMQANTRIYTSRTLPRQFFLRLVAILSDDQYAQYWKEQSHQSLNNISHMVNLTVPDKYKKSLEAMQQLLEDVRTEVRRLHALVSYIARR